MDGERQREAIVEALRDAPDGLDTSAVANALAVHPNTARWHLGILVDAGLVRAEPRHGPGPGRPRMAWRLTGEGAAHGRDDYRLLSTMLTAALADDPEGEERAYATGRRWGRHLQAAEPGAGIAELLDRQGFAAAYAGGLIEMRRCPFLALAEESPQVICTLHRGIMDGVLAAAGAPERVTALRAFVGPSLCVAELAPA